MEERMDFRILNNGSFVPSIGFGTYKTGTLEESEQTVTNALNAGYRLLDTAAYYDNEEAVGNGIKASGINRSDIIITTKIWHTDAGYDATMRAVESSLKKLDTNYIDIMLIHQPLGDYYGSWRAMEELYDQNVLRGLGLSNFYEDRLIDLLYHCNVKPVVNQIECHPFNQRKSLWEIMRKHQIVGMAWSPFTRDRQPIFDHPIIKSLAEKYGKTKHQIILRWHIQRGMIPLPKSNFLEHMKSNCDVFDFKLSITDMDLMELLDQRAFLENHHTAAGLERILQLK
ncbi:aldo/keto reductase [Veillonella tobetsuensis]|uniref:2,5-diketo-D-gluconic acid reductase n=1 Tax=Veillonella tobetsuensis TaxID=1110546 RepID=A0A480B3E9_9FIRM|nr:aldo/keto reductase [Veillonella tobetsuensis]GCL67232.1 2,5-diketo-D-gluconic acid reductase [Veillonella tobetsuensis]